MNTTDDINGAPADAWGDGLDDAAPAATPEADGGAVAPAADGGAGDAWAPDGLDDGLGPIGGAAPADSPRWSFGELAQALVDDAILSDADGASKVEDADGFRRLMDAEVRSRVDAENRRALEALDAGAPVDDIRRLEAISRDLEGYDESRLADEGDDGVALRKELIYKRALFDGMDEARASKEVEKSMRAGTDIEDAREALEDMRKAARDAYGNMVAESRRRKEEEEARRAESRRRLESDIMGGDGLTGPLSETVRRRIVNNVMTPSETLPDGRRVTPLQKYCMTDPMASRVLGELFTLTGGFRDLGALAGAKVRKGVSRGLADMERRLQQAAPAAGGGLRYMGGDDGGDAGRYEIEV